MKRWFKRFAAGVLVVLGLLALVLFIGRASVQRTGERKLADLTARLDATEPGWRIDEIEAGGVDEQAKLRELETATARFEGVLHHSNESVKTMPPLPPRSPIQAALNFGAEKYTSIPVPVLAIFACPHDWSRFFPNDPGRRAARLAADTAGCSARAESFARGVPTARVVRIPNADHYVYRSNEPQVIDEMKKFLSTLP